MRGRTLATHEWTGACPIVGIYGIDGTKYASYAYDAFGNCSALYSNGGNTNTAVVNNPFRYRGYYYDIDLNLYYLGSRYYDSYTGRFISPDSFISTGQGFTGYNMYAYCNNNPVMFVDYGGEFPWLILAILVIFTAVGAILGANSDVIIGEQPKEITYENKEDFEAAQNAEIIEEKLSAGERVRNAFVGAGLGLAVGGAIIATGGVLIGAFGGIGASYLGVTAIQGFAIGALAMDSAAFIVLPIFGIEIEQIEYEVPS